MTHRNFCFDGDMIDSHTDTHLGLHVHTADRQTDRQTDTHTHTRIQRMNLLRVAG